MKSDKVQKSETKTRAEVQRIMKGFVEWRLGHTGDPLSLTIRPSSFMTRTTFKKRLVNIWGPYDVIMTSFQIFTKIEYLGLN